jgi:hypothetical protein
MKGVDEAGRAVDSDRADAPESGGILAGLDVPALRAFIIGVLRGGGVPNARIAEAMRCSRASLYRDAKGADPRP